MIRRPPRSTPFPTRRSSDLPANPAVLLVAAGGAVDQHVERGPHRGAGLGERDLLLREHQFLDALPLHLVGKLSRQPAQDRKSTRLNSSHANISYAVFCLKKK